MSLPASDSSSQLNAILAGADDGEISKQLIETIDELTIA
jgi:hypothetical protein